SMTCAVIPLFFFFFSSRRRHTRFSRDWSSDVCSSDLLQGEKALGPALRKVSLALAKNPLVIAPVLGALWAWGGVPLPGPAADLLNILGAATTPCALVSLGLFLAHKQQEPTPGVMPLVAMKLI